MYPLARNDIMVKQTNYCLHVLDKTCYPMTSYTLQRIFILPSNYDLKIFNVYSIILGILKVKKCLFPC